MKSPQTANYHGDSNLLRRSIFSTAAGRVWPRESGKEKAHKHKQIFPVTARVGGVSRQGSPDRWPGVKSLCAVCGTQEI